MSELTRLTIADARAGLKQKKFSAAELADAHLAAIEKARSLNAYVLETPDKALEMARASDARRAKGEAGPLEGASLGVKDLFCTDGIRTTAGSKILDKLSAAHRGELRRLSPGMLPLLENLISDGEARRGLRK